jgi:uncharacterized protein YycO
MGATPQVRSTSAFIGQVMRDAAQGHLTGQYQGRPNRADFSVLQPGDVLLCHNRDGGYGYWTHAVLYVGRDLAVDADNFVRGTALYPLRNYHHYDELCVLRAKVNPETRAKIAAYAMDCVGRPYDPFGIVKDAHSEYCSKLIWQAHAAAGIQLCPEKAWILPDDISKSHQLLLVGRWGA